MPKCECDKPITLCDRLNCAQSTFIHNPPQMTNDKLPHAMGLQIDRESDDYRDACPNVAPHIAYNAGATAWAPWKVKHDKLQAQTQRMADALESLKSLGWQNWQAQEIAEKALQQFKDGKGKEVENER